MKRCSKCGDLKDESEFFRNCGSPDGLRPDCKICTRLVNLRWQKNNPEKHKEIRRAAAIRFYHADRAKSKTRNRLNWLKVHAKYQHLMSAIKKGGCVVCGEKREACLVFHHIEGKDTEVSKLRTAHRKLVELSKCIVICANCHLLHHVGGVPLPEGISPIEVGPFEALAFDARHKRID